jgi:Domain of unknown function (DUF5615)
LRFLTDENFDNRILAGLRRRRPAVDILRVQDSGLYGAEDPVVLAWAAGDGRVLLTHDTATIPPFAYERVLTGLVMPGVIEVPFQMPIGEAIEELLLIVDEGQPADLENQVLYLPL